jgi:5-methylcytosine-specific restriction endonuclease McrA
VIYSALSRSFARFYVTLSKYPFSVCAPRSISTIEQMRVLLFGVDMKRCSKCKTWKSKVEFYKNASNKDGLHSRCKQCYNEDNSKYREENAEKVRERHRKYREENPEKVREGVRKWQQANLEKMRENIRKWTKENPDKVKAKDQRRAARKAGNGGSFTAEEWQDLCERYDYRCLCCGEQKKLEADHVIPLTKGGTSNIDNIQCLCRSCNARKGAKTIDYRIGLL